MSEAIRITKAKALSLLRQARDEAGKDYVDPLATPEFDECLYKYDPKDVGGGIGRCIVGQVLHYLGVPDDALASFAGDVHNLFDTDPENRAEQGDLLRDHYGITITDTAQDVLAAAQWAQDKGAGWGDAVEEASTVKRGF